MGARHAGSQVVLTQWHMPQWRACAQSELVRRRLNPRRAAERLVIGSGRRSRALCFPLASPPLQPSAESKRDPALQVSSFVVDSGLIMLGDQEGKQRCRLGSPEGPFLGPWRACS